MGYGHAERNLAFLRQLPADELITVAATRSSFAKAPDLPAGAFASAVSILQAYALRVCML
jgi:hypothetical protein